VNNLKNFGAGNFKLYVIPLPANMVAYKTVVSLANQCHPPFTGTRTYETMVNN